MKNDKLQYESFYEEVHRLIGVNSIDVYGESLPISGKKYLIRLHLILLWDLNKMILDLRLVAVTQ